MTDISIRPESDNADAADDAVHPAVPPGRSPLLDDSWSYIPKTVLDEFDRADWTKLNAQRAIYYGRRQADAVLDLLRAGEHEPTFGYQINNFQHCLQAATLAQSDGRDEEDIVVALLHDVGFLACPERHGAFAAELLGGYVSDANYWMLRHHQAFGAQHVVDHPDDHHDPDQRERWRGHPHFDWTAQFVERYDVNAIDPGYANRPLDFFEPLVRRVFDRPVKKIKLD
jgi:predicted HD phosphohydrolase